MTGMLVWWKIVLFALLGSSLFFAGTLVHDAPATPSAEASLGFTRVARLSREAQAPSVHVALAETDSPQKGDIKYFIAQTKEKQSSVVAPKTTASVHEVFAPVVVPAVSATSSKTVVSAFDSGVGSVAVAYGTGIPSSSLPAEECHFETTLFPRYRNLIINEVGWMGTAEESSHEWIELKNPEIDPMPIKGYWLIDEAEQIAVQFPEITVPSGGFVLLERGEDALPDHTADLIYAGALSNSNEGLRVFDSYCVLLDSVIAGPKWPAGSATEKRSMERGGDWEWYTYTGKAVNDILGTPGKKNVAASRTATASSGTSSPPSSTTIAQPESASVTTSSAGAATTPSSSEEAPEPVVPVATGGGVQHLILSEVFAGSEQSSDDEFIELFNPTGQAIDLTGWSLKKKSSSGSESSLVASTRLQGKSVAAGSYFLIARDQKYLGSVSPDASWASSISLAYTNNAVLLYDAGGAVVDETAWTELTKGQSWKREPITGEIFSAGSPSPKQ